MDALPLLSLLVLVPLAGAVMIGALPRAGQARWGALIATLAGLGVSLAVLARFDAAEPGFQLLESAVWIPSLNVRYLVGVDGLSVLFPLFTALLFVGVIIASWRSVRTQTRLWFALLLLLQAATQGVFIALDTVLFFLFWELTLIPMFFLVSLWGIGPNRRPAATKYALVMLVGGVPLLFGFLLLAFNHAAQSGLGIPAGLAFDLPTLLGTPLPRELGIGIFLLLLFGFAVKTPLFPLHTWLPVVAAEGPAVVVALLVGLKLGAYGLIRFAVPLAPEAAHELHWLLAGLGAVGVLYGALAALAQTNLRYMLAYSSMAHVGLVVLGIASFSVQGLQGAVLQLLNFSVIAGGLFLLTGMLHQRTGSSEVGNLGGAARTLPLLAGFFLFFGLAGIGLPGTSGFPAELLILISAFDTHVGAGFAALFGMVIGVAYLLIGFRRAFLGPVTSVVVRDAPDLRPREVALMAVLSVYVLGVGFFPWLPLDLMAASATEWVGR